jgi:Mg2+/citrate symporter
VKEAAAVFEQIVAALALGVCVVLLLRLALPQRQRRRVDAAWRQAVQSVRLLPHRLRFGRAQRRSAQQEADEAIRRARRKAERDGNVVRPDAFKGPRKPH